MNEKKSEKILQLREILDAFRQECATIEKLIQDAEDGLDNSDEIDRYLEDEEDDIVISIIAEDGHTYNADLIACFEVNGKEFCAVLSHEEEPDGSYPIQLFGYSSTQNSDGTETMELFSIESDEDFEAAEAKFNSMLEETEEDYEEDYIFDESGDYPKSIVIQNADGKEYLADVVKIFNAGIFNRQYCAVIPREGGKVQFFRYSDEDGATDIFSDTEMKEVIDRYDSFK